MTAKRQLGKANYDAFAKACKGRSLVSGEPLPEFEDQSEEMMDSWSAAAAAVVDFVTEDAENAETEGGEDPAGVGEKTPEEEAADARDAGGRGE